MRHVSILASALAVLLICLFVSRRFSGGAVAQDGTPPPEGFALPAGVSAEPLGFGRAETLPSPPASMALVRFTFAPGSRFVFDPNDPAVALVYVESGALTLHVGAPLSVTRAAMMATPETAPFEAVAAGTEITLGPGDSAVFPPFAAGELRNDGTGLAVALVANIVPEAVGTPP